MWSGFSIRAPNCCIFLCCRKGHIAISLQELIQAVIYLPFSLPMSSAHTTYLVIFISLLLDISRNYSEENTELYFSKYFNALHLSSHAYEVKYLTIRFFHMHMWKSEVTTCNLFTFYLYQ